MAVRYLEDNGHRIVDRNFFSKMGEIDIIAEKYKGNFWQKLFRMKRRLIFVEVKTRNLQFQTKGGNFKHKRWKFGLTERNFHPENNFGNRKFLKIAKVAQIFMMKKGISMDTDWQIDLMAIEMKNGQKPIIRHYENVSHR